jgi:TonB-linked SusC/RagA family outer membrane protein
MKKFLLLTVFFLPALIMIAQNRTIEGKIINPDGKPVSFATVTIKGTTTAVSADENGNFSIQAPVNAVLIFSAASFQSTEINIGTQTSINVSLLVQGALNEVVVIALGIRRADKALGYSVTKVDPNILVQKSEPDVLKSLQGQVAGVDIRTSQGTPGAATRIQVRGNSSFFSDNQPLIVVDGVPYSNDQVTTSSQTSGGGAYGAGISDLDPNDIASMNILKGSSAAALYGSRASNGVIMITTKSGSVSRARKGFEINLKSGVSFETIANFPEYQNDFGTGSQGVLGGGSNGSWGKHFAAGDSQNVWADYARAYPELFSSTGKVAYQAHPGNVESQFRTGVVYENSVGFNGGDEKSAFSLTASQLNHSGYVPNSNFNRSNLSLGGSTKLGIGVNVRANFSYSRSDQSGGIFGENQTSGVIASSEFARSLFLGRSWDMSLPYEDKLGNSIAFISGGFDNAFWSYKYNTSKTFEEREIAGMHFDFNLTKWAKVDYNVGTNINNLDRTEIQEVSTRGSSPGFIRLDHFRKQEIESTLLLSLNPPVGNDFTVRATFGTSYNQRTSNRLENEGDAFIVRGTHNITNTATQQILLSAYSRRRLVGVFGDLTLGYKNWAFVTATGRNDWSSTLPIQNRSYFYPSVSGSIIFTDALKISNSILDYGKIRGGWAKVGRDAAPYQLEDVFGILTNFVGQSRGTLPNQANNPLIKPEFTREYEAGTQLSFLKRKIELDFTWYDKLSTNLIAPISTPPSTGYASLVSNFGSISNKGIEVELTVRPLKTSNLSWEVKGIFTKNKNIVESLTTGVPRIFLGGGFNTYAPYLEAGKPYGFIRGIKALRDSTTGQFLINPADGTLIKSNDFTQIGDPNPDYKLGISTTINYKGFFLYGLFDMTKGGDLYSVTVQSLLGRGVTLDTRDRETGWVIPGVYGDPNTGKAILQGGKTVPNQTRISTNDLYFSPTGGNTFAINTASEMSVYDATVYRLRELAVGYNIPKSVFKKLPIGSMTFTVTGRNLWFLAPGFPKYTNFDPEVNTYGATNVQGFEFSAAPTSKRIGVNLNITF